MSAATEQQPYSVQKLRGRFALVWWEPDHAGEPKRRRRQLESEDRQSAEAEARKVWEDGDDSPWTVGRIMSAYTDTLKGKPSKPRRDDAWKAMKPFWENVDPKLIDDKMCQRYRKGRRVGDTTARYELLQLSTALHWAVNDNKLDRKPKLWLPAIPERAPKHLERAEFARFLAGARADHARLYMLLGIYTLARPGAILDLTWDRVDFPRRRIDFTPPNHVRTNKRRVIVPISDDLLVALQTGYAARTSAFVIERGGDKVKTVKKAFQAASERSNVRATPYTLRHTGAVWMAEAGVSMAEIAQFMGHDDDRTTQKYYARFSPDFLQRAANAIGNVAGGSM